MVKWPDIEKIWKEEEPKHFWTHWGHDTYSENDPFWAIEMEHPKCLCRTCKVWWIKGGGKV